jgi:hypothetical protein
MGIAYFLTWQERLSDFSPRSVSQGVAEGKMDLDPIEQVRVRVLPDGRMSRDDAARYLGHAPKTLQMWAF